MNMLSAEWGDRMKIYMIKAGICAVSLILAVFLVVDCCGKIPVKVQSKAGKPVVLIDPGHGGIDGGAVSADGTVEKDINLDIAVRVAELAKSYDCCVVMTRTEDISLGEGAGGSIRAMKTADLKARREMMCDYDPVAAVSIHLNSFKEDPAVNGAQVFYPGYISDKTLHEQCADFASVMQRSVSGSVSAEKERTPLVKEDVFLFKDEVCPIVIVECGFLSNPEEADLLKKGTYQQRLAEGIMAGIVEFAGLKRIANLEVIDSSGKKNK